LSWHVTVVCTLVDSYVVAAAREAGSAAEEAAAARKSGEITGRQRLPVARPIQKSIAKWKIRPHVKS